ncbi:DUF421 domain-containing protein [Metabacillus sp. GX 13764]|uniref:DUF421 domain-containing protein n=1 Tax=Metabacillus kandeliae TaxID=2900151 RepID=UPI001E52B289|nr:DUF421 domain-containing protein [Metabacillus kandeliae]MCD7034793.1 DUF421 domain-containing protein [Metabacillus kandeliae]
MTVLEVTAKILLTYVLLLLLTRLMGKKEISQMTFFNFVSAITIGTLGGSLITDQSLGIRNGVLILVEWTVITIIAGYIGLQSKGTRRALEGEPSIVIKNGKVMEETLKKLRLDMEGLKAQLREKDIFSIGEADTAIIETNGKLSVRKKNAANTFIFPETTEIASEGKANLGNLAKLHLSEEWLHNQLIRAGAPSLENVFYAEIQKNGLLYVDLYQDRES